MLRAALLLALVAGVCAEPDAGADVVAAAAAVRAGGGPARDPVAATVHNASFSRLFPPVFRVILLVALGVVGFGADVQILQSWGLSLWQSLEPVRLPSHRPSESHPPPTSTTHAERGDSGAKPVYAIALCHVLYALVFWVFYRACTAPVTGKRTYSAQCIEAATIVGLVTLWCVPGPFRRTQRAFARTLMRIISPSLRQTVVFSDVLVADALTSFAKVLGDVWLSVILLVYTLRGETADDAMLWSRQTSIEMPLLTSIPSLIRLRQCIASYRTAPRNAHGQAPTRHLFNALKYASAFPVIWLGAAEGRVPLLIPKAWLFGFSEASLSYVLWLTSVLFNTVFSFYWDITYDWGLDLLQTSTFANINWRTPRLPVLHRRAGPRNEQYEGVQLAARTAHGRRASVLRTPEKPLPLPASVYYILIVVNLLLRFTWSLKLSSHLHQLVEWENGLLLLEALELVRRSAWILLRVEWELVCQEQL